MSVRRDRFAVGDKVTWFDEHYATITKGRASYGNGPFEVVKVMDRPFENYSDYDVVTQSNWQAMGHTQHIKIDKGNGSYSGAFFKKVD